MLAAPARVTGSFFPPEVAMNLRIVFCVSAAAALITAALPAHPQLGVRAS
jgi:hypothetical protein